LRRLDGVAARTNCVADRDDAAVLESAARGSEGGVLQGEAVTVKDWIDVAGFRCSGGDVAHRDRRPDGDATAVGGGVVRLGIGSDSGGSVRVPAA
jgi:Asp-tRNA(Asn)/Glu-tRNA(Gln) amidotransferase A subunit family amidase